MPTHTGTVAISGASGHVGGNLARALVAQGRRVRLLVRDDRRAIAGVEAESVRADVLDAASLRRALEGVEVVYHLAAKISIEGRDAALIHQVNVEGVRHMMRACLDARVRRVVHFSSIHAFAEEPFLTTLDETRGPPPPEAPPYNQSKAAGQREVAAAVREGLDAVIVNPTAVLGPCDYKVSAMGEVLLGLARRKLPALVEGGFDWVDVRDVVAGALAAEERGRTGERYLLSGHWLPVAGLARLVEEVTGVRGPRFTSPMWLARLGAPFVERFSRLIGVRPLYTSASLSALRSNRAVSHDKATRELGYTSRPLRDTVADTLRWHQEQGNLPGGLAQNGGVAAAG